MRWPLIIERVCSSYARIYNTIKPIFKIFYSQVSTHIEVDRALTGEGGGNSILPEPKVQPPAVSTSTLISNNFRYVFK